MLHDEPNLGPQEGLYFSCHANLKLERCGEGQAILEPKFCTQSIAGDPDGEEGTRWRQRHHRSPHTSIDKLSAPAGKREGERERDSQRFKLDRTPPFFLTAPTRLSSPVSIPFIASPNLARAVARGVSSLTIAPNLNTKSYGYQLESSMVSRPHPLPMCKTRRAAVAYDPKPRPSCRSSSSYPITDSISYRRTTASTSSSSSSSAASVVSKTSSSASLAALRHSLPETPTLYPFSEIWAATNNFPSSSSSSSSRRCSLRGKDAVVFQRPFQGDPAALPARLVAVCKSHHNSLVRLLGTSLAGDNIYLVYEHMPGASLADCLRNPRNPNFTPLSSWMSRIQVAADLAQGLEYIHHHSATIHNRLKASSVLVTEPHFRAKICHFGAADLAGEIPATTNADADADKEAADAEFSPSSPPSCKLKRSDSRRLKIDGTRGYMAPELLAGGNISQRSDGYALGVVLLELISGEEPLKYRFDKEHNDFHRVSLIETAREAFGPEEDSASQERRGRVRRWVDRRLRDSYPVEAAEDLIRVALRCVEAEAAARPDMTWVAGKVSKIFLDSKAWEKRVRVPTEFSVSIAPR